MKSVFQSCLYRIKDEIFSLAFDIDICGFTTINSLADSANLSHATVKRLYEGDTKEPRLSTIFKLAKAIKMDLGLLKEELGIKKKRRRKVRQ